jgi:hypothetical protein
MSTIRNITVFLLVSFVFAGIVSAAIVPQGPDSTTEGAATTKAAVTGDTVTATAGNINSLVLTATTVTQTWQGYYGNITGVISLEDASGNPLYNWSLDDPEGLIFATTKTTAPDWADVVCWDQSSVDTDNYYTLAEYRSALGLVDADVDDIDTTFTDQNHAVMYFAGVTISANSCDSVAYLFNSSGEKEAGVFVETLLYDPDAVDGSGDGDIIFTAIIEDGAVDGFNDIDNDFQLMVGENGHNSNAGTTTYYIYAYIE